MTTRLIACLLGTCLLGAGAAPALAQRSRGQSSDVGAGARPAETTVEQDEARSQLMGGTEEVAVLAVHAKTLLDAGDIDTLRAVLVSTAHRSIEGVLQALRVQGDDLLVPETLQLAAGLLPGDVRPIARDNLIAMARSNGRVVDAFVNRIEDETRPDAERLVLVDVLGQSRNLTAVRPLITLLFGPHGEAAHHALESLTGQPGPPPGTPRAEFGRFWSDFWEAHDDLPRDQLLELALESTRQLLIEERRLHAESVLVLHAEVIEARTQRMGTDVDLLVKALLDPYREVRLEAAARLGAHGNKQQASAAVPVLLVRLGRAGPSGGDSASHSGSTTSPDGGNASAGNRANGARPSSDVFSNGNGAAEIGLEVDPAVRAAMVSALGILGRNQDAVLGMLSSELRSPHAEVARAAVAGLSLARRRPDVVRPLLDYLEPAVARNREIDAETAVIVLQAVAENQPRGVIPRLHRWLDAVHGPRVRAAAIRALLASDDVDAALDELAAIDVDQDHQLVRYNVALGLGVRALDLSEDSSARTRILALLARLVDDSDPSVRAEAATSLGMTGELGGLVLLERRSQVESDPSVLRKIVQALGELGFADGVRVMGRLYGQRPPGRNGEGDPDLQDVTQQSLAAIGRDADASVWLAMGDQLREVSALPLAAWAYAEVERRFSAAPEYRLVVNEAKGNRARVLWDAGECQQAVRLLRELHAAAAPHPPPRDRLEMIASCSERLGDHGAAADAYLELLGMVQEGAAGRADVQRDAVRTLRAAGRFQQAVPLLEGLIEADGANNDLLLERGRLQAGLGQWELAVATYERLFERIPEDDEEFRAQVAALLADLRTKISLGAGDNGQGETGADGDGDR